MGRGYTPPQPTRGSGGALWAPPAGSGAEPRTKTNLVHFMSARRTLIATITIYLIYVSLNTAVVHSHYCFERCKKYNNVITATL